MTTPTPFPSRRAVHGDIPTNETEMPAHPQPGLWDAHGHPVVVEGGDLFRVEPAPDSQQRAQSYWATPPPAFDQVTQVEMSTGTSSEPSSDNAVSGNMASWTPVDDSPASAEPLPRRKTKTSRKEKVRGRSGSSPRKGWGWVVLLCVVLSILVSAATTIAVLKFAPDEWTSSSCWAQTSPTVQDPFA